MSVSIGTAQFLTIEQAMCRQVDAAIDALEKGDFDVTPTLAGAAETRPRHPPAIE